MDASWDDLLLGLDVELLAQLLGVIDAEVARVNAALDGGGSAPFAFDEDLADRANGLDGLGFVACQQYINLTYRKVSALKKTPALKHGPTFSADLSCAEVINAAANFWKHQGEWDGTGNLEAQTRSVLDKVFPSSKAWPMVNVLYELLQRPEDARFADVVPLLVQWRDDLRQKK